MKTIEIAGKAYPVKYSFRMYMLFESSTGHAYRGGGTMTEELTLFLSAIWAADKDCTLTLIELSDALDETPEALNEWRDHFARCVEAQNARMAGVKTTDDDGEGKKKA